MKERFKKILDLIPDCDVFADIGCDHGYVTLAMLKTGKCKKAIISDISSQCLAKAIDLLKDYINSGSVTHYVTNGFNGLPLADAALIAGMGGEEIISILNSEKTLPKTLVLQPMKNADKVRKNLVILGYRLERDFTFMAGSKFYDIILAKVGNDELTEDEILFGRDNLKDKGQAFIKKIKIKLRNKGIYQKKVVTL